MWITSKTFFTLHRTYHSVSKLGNVRERGKPKMNFCLNVRDFLSLMSNFLISIRFPHVEWTSLEIFTLSDFFLLYFIIILSLLCPLDCPLKLNLLDVEFFFWQWHRFKCSVMENVCIYFSHIHDCIWMCFSTKVS